MSVLGKRKKFDEYMKIIKEHLEMIWLCKMMRRTKYCLLILRSVFRGGFCGEKGENKNNRGVNRPE